jgi:fibronectin type 3 domain-containing protein
MKTLKRIISTSLAVLMIATTMTAISASAVTIKAPKVTLSNTEKGVKIKWAKAKGAVKYKISRKLSSAKKSTVIKTVKSGKAGSFVDTKAKAGKKYVYTVTSVSGKASADTAKTIVRLKAPTSVKATANTASQKVKLTWKKSTGAKKYEIYRAKVTNSKVGTYTKVATSTSTTGYDKSPVSGSDYKYKVKAVNGSSNSALSTASSKVSYLENTTLVVRMNEDYNAVSLYWQHSSNDTSYRIYRSEGTSKTYKKIADIKASSVETGLPVDIEFSSAFLLAYKEYVNQVTASTYTDKDVTNGTTYKYYVEVITKDGFYRSEPLTIKCDDADITLKSGETDDEFSVIQNMLDMNSDTVDEYGASIEKTFVSDNMSVATVDNNGVITAVAPGVANISVQINVTSTALGIIKMKVCTITTNVRVKVTEN